VEGMVEVMEAAMVATAGAISIVEATACTVRISVARATWAAGPQFRVRLRSKARAAATRKIPSHALGHCDMGAC